MESGQSDAVTVSQPDTPCQAQMPSARYGQSASQLWSCRQITGLGQTPMKSVFSQTQPDRLGLSGSDGVCGQSDMVVSQTQPVSHS